MAEANHAAMMIFPPETWVVHYPSFRSDKKRDVQQGR